VDGGLVWLMNCLSVGIYYILLVGWDGGAI
jgi:hypothetical protein